MPRRRTELALVPQSFALLLAAPCPTPHARVKTANGK
jgi:hypothetical protein